MESQRPLLLIVDDDDLDVLIVRRALNDMGITNPIVRMKDGEEAFAYLETCLGEVPCVVLLDLNMPRMDGFEFLRQVKAHPKLKDVPVIVLTTSTSEADMMRSYELGALDYVVKSMDSTAFRKNLCCIRDFCRGCAASQAEESTGLVRSDRP